MQPLLKTLTKRYVSDPNYAEAYYNRGFVNGDRADYEAAIADFETVIRLDPMNDDAYDMREAAMKALHADTPIVIDPHPTNPLAFGDTPLDLEELMQLDEEETEEYEAAVEAANKAIRSNPKDTQAYYNRAVAQNNLANFEDAIKDCDEVIRQKPEFAEAYGGRAFAKDKLGHTEAAIADYDEAIRRKSDYAEAYFNRGLIKAQLEQYEAAIVDCNEVIRLNPEEGLFYFTRGFITATLAGEPDKDNIEIYEDVIADYDEAIRLEPDFMPAHFSRIATNATLDRGDAAQASIEEMLQLENPFTEIVNMEDRAGIFHMEDMEDVEDIDTDLIEIIDTKNIEEK